MSRWSMVMSEHTIPPGQTVALQNRTRRMELPVPEVLYYITYHPGQRFHRNYAPPTSSFASVAMSYAGIGPSTPEASHEWTDGAQSGMTGTSLGIGF